MPTVLTINLMNNSAPTEPFYVFQQPAVLAGGAQVHSVSLDSGLVGSYSATGSMLSFQPTTEPYACIEQARQPVQLGMLTGFASAYRAMELAPGANAADSTTASFGPLGLSAPVNHAGVRPGAFRIIVTAYPPTQNYNVGAGVQMNGRLVMSSFIEAMPNFVLECQPVLKFYVQQGDRPAGTVIDFGEASINAALCDFTGGQRTANVQYNSAGNWKVQTY